MTTTTPFQKHATEWVMIHDLKTHPEVQRALRQWKVDEIVADFDPAKFRELYVAKVGGQYLVFDGQHRLAAALKVLGPDQRVPCRVYENVSVKRQAELFLGLNDQMNVTSLDKWFVRRLAGEAVVVDIERVLALYRLRVSKAKGPEGTVVAVKALEWVWQRGGEPLLRRLLKVLTAAWGRKSEAFDGVLVRGLTIVLERAGTDLEDDELARRLARAGGGARMVGMARDYARATDVTVPMGCAVKVLGIYNKGRRTMVHLNDASGEAEAGEVA